MSTDWTYGGAGDDGGSILPGGQMQVDPYEVTQALLRAAQGAATKALTAEGADCKDFADAALKVAQAIVLLDPRLGTDGREAAPTPARRKSVQVMRDADGRMQSLDVANDGPEAA